MSRWILLILLLGYKPALAAQYMICGGGMSFSYQSMADGIADCVNKKMAEGYSIYGNMACNKYTCFQALVKPNKQEEQNVND